MKKFHSHAAVIAAIVITQLVGCGQDKKADADKSFDAKAIGIQKFKGNSKPLDEVTNACAAELESSGKCDGQAADLLIRKSGQSSPVKVIGCQAEVQADASLKACRALTDSIKTYDLIMAQRPTGRYDEKRAREMWGDRFIEIGE